MAEQLTTLDTEMRLALPALQMQLRESSRLQRAGRDYESFDAAVTQLYEIGRIAAAYDDGRDMSQPAPVLTLEKQTSDIYCGLRVAAITDYKQPGIEARLEYRMMCPGSWIGPLNYCQAITLRSFGNGVYADYMRDEAYYFPDGGLYRDYSRPPARLGTVETADFAHRLSALSASGIVLPRQRHVKLHSQLV